MRVTDRLVLDNLFSINKLGEVYAVNPLSANIWYTNEHDYVTIVVPEALNDRFRAFWHKARMVLDERLRTHYMQEGTPLSGDFYLKETWYFITVDGAKGMLEKFYDILPYNLPKVQW